MTDLYLIAHIARGEPTFDIASPMDGPDGEEWWIMSSGHRCYPYWTFELAKLLYIPLVVWETETTMAAIINQAPDDHPDFWGDTFLGSDFAPDDIETKTKAQQMLAQLGLAKPKKPAEELKRRI